MTVLRTLGILSPLVSNAYFGSLLRGIQRAAAQQGARTIAIQTRDPWALHSEDAGVRAYSYPLAWEYVDGWIAITDAVPPAYLHAITQARKPLVLISWDLPALDCPVVLPDNHGGTREAVRHLLAHGHTRIAFVGFLEHPNIRERYDGYQAALLEHGLTPDPGLCINTSDMLAPGGRGAAEQILASGAPCTAVVTGTDLNALGLIEALQSAGLRVPEDIAVAGFDDISAAEYAAPALTTVRQPFETLARMAGDLLLAKLAGEAVASGPHLMACPLVVRRSCGCLPTSAILSPSLGTPATLSWEERLAEELVWLARGSVPAAPDEAPTEIWPGLTTLVQGVAAAISGGDGPSDQACAQAWREAIALTSDLRILRAMVARLNDLAQPQIPPADDAARARLSQFLDMALSEMLHARLRAETARGAHFEQIIATTYDAANAILAGDPHTLQGLTWLGQTSATYGCLGLWDSTQAQLVVAGMFQRAGDTPEVGSICPPERFPPPQVLQAPVAAGEMLMLFPVRTPQRDWGILAVVGPIEAQLESGRSTFSQATAVLSIALERDELFQSLLAQQTALRAAYEQERILAATIREIGAPIIPLLPQVLLIPLIGTIDTARAQHLMETALADISRVQATEVLLDLTGVPLVDTQVAGALLQVARAAVLLGANVVLVGVRPEIAQSLVSLGIDLRTIDTQPTLSAAVKRLLRRRAGQDSSRPTYL